MTATIPRLYTNEELSALTLDISTTAFEKGWWPGHANPRQPKGEGGAVQVAFADGEIEEKMVLVIGELSEAMEEYRHPESDLALIYYVLQPPSVFEPLRVPRGDVINAKQVPYHHVQDHIISDDLMVGLAKTKPEGFPVEMADAYIRILDLVGAMNTVPEPVELYHVDNRPHELVGKHLHAIMKAAFTDEPVTRILSVLLARIEWACSAMGCDLRLAIELKTTYNKTRPHRHGGKKA